MLLDRGFGSQENSCEPLYLLSIIYSKNKPDNGIMEPRFNSVAAYNDEIKKQQEHLKTIHKNQFASMLKNDGSAVDALEKQYKATEKSIADLKDELGEVMGANVRGKRGNQLLDDERWGSYVPEEGEKHSPNKGNMPPIGNAGKPRLDMSSGKPQFAAKDTAAHVTGLDDGADSFFGYKPEDYEDETDGDTTYDYISEKDFNTQLTDMKKQLGMRETLARGYNDQMSASSLYDPKYGSYQHGYSRNLNEASKLRDQIEALNEQREWSEKADGFANKTYDTEEEAALAFADPAVTQTGKDNVEMGAMIIHMDVPVVDANGNIVMQKKYVLGDVFKGNHADIIDGLASSYVDFAKMWWNDQMERQDIDLTGSVEDIGYSFANAMDTLVNDGITVSFVHTHPYCSGHEENEFSGGLGKTPDDVINYFAQGTEDSIKDAINAGKISGFDVFNPVGLVSDIVDAIKEGGNNGYYKDAAYYIGDQQVPWLPGVERIYLASPISKELYAADINGPIMDPNNPSKYDVLGTFNSYIPTEWPD